MKITIQKFDNGNIAASMDSINISHAGVRLVSEKVIEVVDEVAQDYFKNPDMYIVDFEKGEINAKSSTA